jgi:hypothetical protein
MLLVAVQFKAWVEKARAKPQAQPEAHPAKARRL